MHSVRVRSVRQRFDASAMSQSRLATHRSLLLWVHIVFAGICGLAFLSRFNFSAGAWLGGRSGIRMLFWALPAFIPYILSGIHSRRIVGTGRLGLALFLCVLVAGTALASLIFLNIIPVESGFMTMNAVITGQAVAYILLAQLLLNL
jgi:hypothetical protein